MCNIVSIFYIYSIFYIKYRNYIESPILYPYIRYMLPRSSYS